MQYGYMKATIDIPDDLYRLTRIRAAETGATIRSLVIDGLRRELGLASDGAVSETPVQYDAAGWPVRRPGAAITVTDEFVNRLREQEGV